MLPGSKTGQPTRLERLIARMRAQGHRISPQRRAILEAFLSNTGHPSVEMVFALVSRRFPSMSLATVYKTLTVLKEMDEVLELSFAGQESRFDARMPKPHPHLVCTRCGRIVDPPFIDLAAATRDMARHTGFRIERHRLDFYGLCPSCQGESAPS